MLVGQPSMKRVCVSWPNSGLVPNSRRGPLIQLQIALVSENATADDLLDNARRRLHVLVLPKAQNNPSET